jgi:hypothetical protein
MTTDTEIRAADARQLLNNQIFKEVFGNVEGLIIDQIKASPLNDSESRNQLGLALSALHGIETDIHSAIDTVMLENSTE